MGAWNIFLMIPWKSLISANNAVTLKGRELMHNMHYEAELKERMNQEYKINAIHQLKHLREGIEHTKKYLCTFLKLFESIPKYEYFILIYRHNYSRPLFHGERGHTLCCLSFWFAHPFSNIICM